jgi:hypothetical protein
MLARERRRCVWSLAIGIALGVAVFGYWNEQARVADARLRRLVALPPGYTLKPIEPGAVPTVMNPSAQSADSGGGRWVPESPGEAQIADTAQEAKDDRANGRFFGLLTFVAFCFPLGWYFLLDRLREISDAVSGRDR